MGTFRKLNPCSCRACISGFNLQAYKAAQERFSFYPELLKGCKYIMDEKILSGPREEKKMLFQLGFYGKSRRDYAGKRTKKT